MNKNLPKKELLDNKQQKMESIRQAMTSVIDNDFTLEGFTAEEKRVIENTREQHNTLPQEKNTNKFKPKFDNEEDKKILSNVIKKIGKDNFEKTKKKELTPEEIEKTIEYRDKQNITDRYCEYMTGMTVDDPRLPERLEEDQKIIRAKYGLPNKDIIFNNPSEYENRLRLIAKKKNISITPKIEAGAFLKESKALASYIPCDKSIIINIDKTSLEKYQQSILALEHEIIHVLQVEHYPGKPLELMEYEAHLANVNINAVKQNGAELFFTYRTLASLKNNYLEKVKWNNPQYFLTKIDGISEEAIEAYRQKQKALDKN